jgi:hypothetical protein
MSEFGPFVHIMALVAALGAVFASLVVQSIGPLERWTNLVDDSPTFLIAAGPRLLAVALIAGSYIWATTLGSEVFAVLAVLAAVLGYLAIRAFDKLRRSHVVGVPIVGSGGQQARGAKGRLRFRNVVVGSDDALTEQAKRDYRTARERHAGLSLTEFMSGYGSPPNNPESLWPKAVLVRIQMSITGRLMQAVVAGVMTLFWAALAIDIGASARG